MVRHVVWRQAMTTGEDVAHKQTVVGELLTRRGGGNQRHNPVWLQNVRLPVARSVGKAETPVMSASAHSDSAPCRSPERRHVERRDYWIQRVPPYNPERAQGSNSLRVLGRRLMKEVCCKPPDAVRREPSFVRRNGGFIRQATVDVRSIDLSDCVKPAFLSSKLCLELEESVTAPDTAAEIQPLDTHLAEPNETSIQQQGLEATPRISAGAEVILGLIAALQEKSACLESVSSGCAKHDTHGVTNPTTQSLLRISIIVACVHSDHGLPVEPCTSLFNEVPILTELRGRERASQLAAHDRGAPQEGRHCADQRRRPNLLAQHSVPARSVSGCNCM